MSSDPVAVAMHGEGSPKPPGRSRGNREVAEEADLQRGMSWLPIPSPIAR